MSLSQVLLMVQAALYFAAFLFSLLPFLGREVKVPSASLALRIGFLVSTFYLAEEATVRGFFLPVASLAQAFAFFAWSLSFVYLVLLVKIQSEPFALVLSPILFILTAAAFAAGAASQGGGQIPASFYHPYFVLHIGGAFFAYASFTLSFGASLLYLIQHRELKLRHAGTFYHKLPSLEELERLIYQPLSWGAPLLCFAVGIGMLWARLAYGLTEFWNLKTSLTLLTLIFYTVMLVLHRFSALRGQTAAWLSVFSFGLVLAGFLGARFIEGGHYLH